MIEHILLDEPEQAMQRQVRDRKKRSQWLGYVFGSLVLVSATCALVYYMSHEATTDPPLLSTQNVCDACTIYPDLSDHLTCKSCAFGFKKEKLLKCPPGYGDMRFSSVKLNGHSNAKAMVKIQKACREQEDMFDADSTEPFTCRLVMGELMAEEEPEIEPRDTEETVEAVDENGEVVLERRHRGFTTKYICGKNDKENIEYVEPETGDSPALFLSQALVSEPFLANANVKCGNRKQISKYTEIVKSCETKGTFEATCSGKDARMIFLKFKQNGQQKSKAMKKAGKARSSQATNFCFTQETSCTFKLKDILINDETEESMAEATFDFKYICSYGEELTTAAEPVLTSTMETPSELFLQSALLKCGRNKMLADTVEIGKACTDDNFKLTCSAEGQDTRVIVLGFWSGRKTRTGRRVSRKRARLATNICNDGSHIDENNVCSFNLEDVYLDGEDENTFVDTTFNVKYMCSFSQPMTPA